MQTDKQPEIVDDVIPANFTLTKRNIAELIAEVQQLRHHSSNGIDGMYWLGALHTLEVVYLKAQLL